MTDDDRPLDRDEQELRAELLRAARELDVPPTALRARLAARFGAPPRRPQRRLYLLAAAAVLMAAVGGLLVTGRRPQVESAASVRPEPVAAPATNPCSRPFRARGGAPLIDDFEDGDAASRPVEGRGAHWMLHFDYDPEGAVHRYPTPEPRPDATPDNRHALHLTAGELRDWGAILHITFLPHSCYDASAYAGLALRARGPGRVFVGIQTTATTPRQWGGTCEGDCYNSHVQRLVLTPHWEEYTLAWDELRQRGYDGTPLDPRTIHSIVVQLRAEDTPFDVWLDDFAFLER